ncbi:MAG: UDP-N-acetylmuramate dehydrogenase [Oscillospiraceae bacterium]
MNIQQVCTLSENLGCKVCRDKMLKEYTTFKIGGKCPLIVEINSEQALSELVAFCNKNGVRYLVIGKGSNMLCDDKGFDGVAFHLGSDFAHIRLTDSQTVEVEAGCSLIKLCRFALDNSLSGLEFAYGIPGTVGGAVYMNAGAYGGEIKDVLYSVECVDKSGKILNFTAEELDMSYRHSIFQTNDCIITKGIFKLCKGDKNEISEKMNELMTRRKEKQPLEYPNAGSTFKRPVGQFAGKLIQDCGLRGFSVGGAMVSEKHCGFVINYNNATCGDVVNLIKEVQKIVQEQTGYFLECEVKIIPYK